MARHGGLNRRSPRRAALQHGNHVGRLTSPFFYGRAVTLTYQGDPGVRPLDAFPNAGLLPAATRRLQ